MGNLMMWTNVPITLWLLFGGSLGVLAFTICVFRPEKPETTPATCR